MSRALPGTFLSLEDEDWDSFEPIQPLHINGGSHSLSTPTQTPPRRVLQNNKVAESTRPGIYPSLPSPEATPLRVWNKLSGRVFGRLFAQTQLQSPPGTPERVSSPVIPSRPQDVFPRPPPLPQDADPRPPLRTHREVSALPTLPKVPPTRTATKSDAYSTPPVTPTRPKRLNQAKVGYPRPLSNVEVLRGLAARLGEDLSRLEESARQHPTESRTLHGSPIPTAPGSPSEASVRTLDEDDWDDVPSIPSRDVSANAIKDKRPPARATAQSHLDNVIGLSNTINERSTSTRSVGLCPKYADQNWTECTPEGPPAFFYQLPSAIPHLALWPAGGVGIFGNGQSLKYFQACDVAVLVRRERGEKVCDAETVNNVGHILHYEMGLGKTVTTIALIICNPASPKFKGSHATLVVTPNKGIMDHWLSEVAKFAPHLRVCYYDSANALLSETADIVVCTYHQLRRQHNIYRENPESKAPLFQRVWFRVVLDEAHVARNPKTKIAQSIWAVKKWHGLCLTGTPAQNSNHDLYSLFRFLGVTYENINDLETFQVKVCSNRPKAIPRNSKILDIVKRDFLVARNKSLIKLPKRTDTTIEVILTPQERHLYSSVKKWKGFHILARITRLRQVCDHPSLIGEELLSEFIYEDEKPDPEDGVDYTEDELKAPYVDVSKLDGADQEMFSKTYMSSKMTEMMHILKTRVRGQKTIIFTHFVSVITSITHALRGAGIRWTTYSGDMSPASRESSLKKIAQDDKCTVIIVSIMAGGVGLNITACNTVILLEPWWNPSAEEQAISRSYRIGQNLPVHVFRLVVKDSIEESIEKTQIFKREVMKDMYGQCPPIDKCTFEEWLAGP